MKTFLLPIFLIALVLTANAKARLWESQAQMDERLGQPSEEMLDEAPFGELPGCSVRVYFKNNIWCYAYFKDDRDICECFGKAGNAPLTNEELAGLLKADSFGDTWTEIRPSQGRAWRKGNKGASATYPIGPHGLLVITTPRFDEAIKQANDADAKKRVQGF